jgi:hypothetical protein
MRLWLDVERRWRAKYFGKEVITYVNYDFKSYISTPDGRLYIPYEFGKEYGDDKESVIHF